MPMGRCAYPKQHDIGQKRFGAQLETTTSDEIAQTSNALCSAFGFVRPSQTIYLLQHMSYYMVERQCHLFNSKPTVMLQRIKLSKLRS
jgi:hypothetical protein